MASDPGKIRDVLREWVVETQPHGEGDALINELCFIDKRRRADLVHANGKLSAFEIKSSADSLNRWPGQQDAYLRVFDAVWLCCHSKHVINALEKNHKSVGLMVVDDYYGLAVIKQPSSNRSVSAYDLAGLLWRSELDSLAKANGIEAPRNLKIDEIRQRVSDSLSVTAIRDHVLSRLKVRYADSAY
ncbi:sce7726 family protein [Chromohalobacter israelensis]|uniref:sce7726 family protein n=1 Tax=Chromohalobacter israelensis TaxID=141390 RepID=UPI000FFEEBB7|nr:hypothetical protein B4O83_12415 [Chromohalobacter salexigens]